MKKEYPPFNPSATCPKCAGEDVGSNYAEPCRDATCRLDKHVERIDRTCRRCHYSWREAPLRRHECV